LPAGVLPDGNYHLAIAAASVADDNGHALRQNATLDFFTLDGDANHDRVVDVADLGRLATNYNVTLGMTFSDGDFNYDGKVDVADLGRLATNYGKTLAKPG
ncbi:MAG TPA: hypothetical protein VLI90_01980, partial [Tepidisphaeraceae bacterium]|nr:hypothetical protein [Tepidisphaeraceae bacterium]